MSTPRQLVFWFRIVAALALAALTVVLLGPFQGLERVVHLSDKEAHALAFYGVTLGLFATLPGWRRTDLALAALSFGALIEIGQGLTGRSLSLADFGCDALGILAAVGPGLVERLRHHWRTCPDIGFAALRQMDRRRIGLWPGLVRMPVVRPAPDREDARPVPGH